MSLKRFILASSAAVLATVPARALTYNYQNNGQSWSLSTAWQPGPVPAVPTGNNTADILVFGGDVALPWTSFNDIIVSPFRLNQITLSAGNVGASQNFHTISGGEISFEGTSPVTTQNGGGGVAFNAPLRLEGQVIFAGNGTGFVTANARIAGIGNIVKNGASTFRFGTPYVAPVIGPSDNRWLGQLVINAGTVRFNNNAESGRSAVRSNPVAVAAGSSFSCRSEMRLGTLTGAGSVFTEITTLNTKNESIVLTALADGEYNGNLTLSSPTGTGNDGGEFVVRGNAKQRLSGPIYIHKDLSVGRGATLELANAATLGTRDIGAVVMNGGTFRLENETSNDNNRLRDGSPTSTGVEPIGGGNFVLSGNAGGTQETVGRLQLGAFALNGQSKHRAGQLNLQIIHRAGGGASTTLTFQSYLRSQQTLPQLCTVDFMAQNANATPQFIALGQAGSNPRIILSTGAAPPTHNGLLDVTTGSVTHGLNGVGWATVTGPSVGTLSTVSTVDFASYGANGVEPISTTPWSAALDATENARITGNAATTNAASNFPVNSIKIAPTSPGLSLNIAGPGHIECTAFLLAGANDYTIRSTGGGGITGASPRFFHVEKATLTLDAGIASASHPIVKAGNGTLALNNTGNVNLGAIVAINSGAVRANPTTGSMPGGELRLRGGVLEIQGGGNFTRTIGLGNGTVNWSGIDTSVFPNVAEDEDRGSGGFAAHGAEATVTLNSGAAINWEALGFIRSGHALLLSSNSATAGITFSNPLNLTSPDGDFSYNAREVRVFNNANSTGDWARMSGNISGTLYNDLLKTGPGILELTATNSYLGSTIVTEGSLLVNGSTANSLATIVGLNGAIGGTGTVSHIILEGGAIQPGSNGIGTLTTTAVNWKAGTLTAELTTTSDRLNVGSGRLLKDPNGTGPYTVDFAGTGEGGRTYTLATFASTNFGTGDFTQANLRPGLTGTFAIEGGNTLVFSTNLPPPTIASHPAAVRVNPGTPFTLSVTTQIPGAYTYQWKKGAQNVDGATGPTLTISSPTLADEGTYTVVVTDGTNPTTSNPAFVNINEAPTATAQTIGVNEDGNTAITLGGTDPDGSDTLTYTVLTQPNRGTLTGTAPNLTYTPTGNYNGGDSFTFKANDGLTDSATGTITLNVIPQNDPPIADDDIALSNLPATVLGNDTDIDTGDTLTIKSATHGLVGTVTIAADKLSLTYTPGPNFTIQDTFTYTVEDTGGATDTATVTVRLSAPITFGLASKKGTVSGEPAGTVYTAIGQPSLSGDGRVTFLASYKGTDKKTRTAIVFGNPPTPIATLGATAAGTTFPWSKFSTPIVNGPGHVAFKATLKGAPGGTADGIWVHDGTTARLVVRTGAAVPGGNGATFSKLGDIALPDDGRLIFSATLKGALSTADTGIWRETGTGTVAKVIGEGDVIRIGGIDRAVKLIALFGPGGKETVGQRRGFNNNGALAARLGFHDGTSAIVRIDSDGTKTALIRTGIAIPALGGGQVKSFNLPTLADDGSATVFATLLIGGPITKTNDFAILRVDNTGAITVVARESSPAKDGTGADIPGSQVTKLTDSISGDNARTGFLATLKIGAGNVTAPNDTGIWRHNAAGTLTLLAREGSPVADVQNATLKKFNALAWTGSVGDSGVAFTAQLKGTVKGSISGANDIGLWVETSDGQMRLAFREGQTVNVGTGTKTVKSFTVLSSVLGSIGQGHATNFVGGYAILATFTDNTTGVVTAWVP